MSASKDKNNKRENISFFLYRDETGNERYRKVRKDWIEKDGPTKTFWFEHKDNAGKWASPAVSLIGSWTVARRPCRRD